MEFLKRHYEKVLLSVVLLGLAVVAALLPSRIQKDRELLDKLGEPIPATGAAYKSLNTQTNEGILTNDPPRLELGAGHKLFAPKTWQKNNRGEVFVVDDPDQLVFSSLQVTNIRELHLRLKYTGLAKGDVRRYAVNITREADPKRGSRATVERSIALNTPVEGLFTARELQGPEEDPSALVVFLNENNERVVLQKDEEWLAPRGFSADLHYDTEGKTTEGAKSLLDKRVDEVLDLNQRKYKIVAITTNEVTVADPNGKPTTIPLTKPQ